MCLVCLRALGYSFPHLLYTTKFPVQLNGGIFVGLCSLFDGVKSAKGISNTVFSYTCLVATIRHKSNTFYAAPVVFTSLAVKGILSSSSKTQIFSGVIKPVSIDVIDLEMCRIFAVQPRPHKTMR